MIIIPCTCWKVQKNTHFLKLFPVRILVCVPSVGQRSTPPWANGTVGESVILLHFLSVATGNYRIPDACTAEQIRCLPNTVLLFCPGVSRRKETVYWWMGPDEIVAGLMPQVHLFHAADLYNHRQYIFVQLPWNRLAWLHNSQHCFHSSCICTVTNICFHSWNPNGHRYITGKSRLYRCYFSKTNFMLCCRNLIQALLPFVVGLLADPILMTPCFYLLSTAATLRDPASPQGQFILPIDCL